MWAALRHLVQDFHFGIEPLFTILKSTSDSHSPLPELFAVQLVDGLAQARRICSVHGPWVALQRQWSKLGRVVLGFCPATRMLAVSKISIAGVSRYDILRMHQYVTLCVVAASTYPRDVLVWGWSLSSAGVASLLRLGAPGAAAPANLTCCSASQSLRFVGRLGIRTRVEQSADRRGSPQQQTDGGLGWRTGWRIA